MEEIHFLDVNTSIDSLTSEETSLLSNGIDEGLEISQRLAESIFAGPDLDAEGEEILLGIICLFMGGRLLYKNGEMFAYLFP